MTPVRQWLLENIGKYGINERHQFLRDCSEENGVCIRTVQKHYKELFLPNNNSFNTDVIENNNTDFIRFQPGVELEDRELVEAGVKLAKKAQRYQDINRIERKSFRDHARVDNAVASYCSDLIDLLDEHSFNDTVEHEENDLGEATGILHLSDLHFNELIDIPGNKYDFRVASRRLKKLVDRAISLFSMDDITEVVVCMTGDLLNSSRRLDELLVASTNRSKATFLSVEILRQVIQHLNTRFNVTLACVSGNESRVNQEMGFTDDLVTDNYDFTIFNILRYIFMDAPGVTFLKGDPYEMVLSINGRNILMTHGYNAKGKIEDYVAKTKGRYASKGIMIDYMIFGHLHSARIGDTYARSSGLCGANAYSERELNLTSRASQNLHIVREDGIDSIKVDLQETDGIEGYPIHEALEAYDAKSLDKTRKKTAIVITELKI